ncbi:MAG: hypothetical protein K6A15_01575 [Treponema sp.]|nr:hypothetical protein [Treponema sp.]
MSELIELIKPKILSFSGIHLAQAQIQTLTAYLEKQAAARGLTAIDYCKNLLPGTSDFDAVINLVTVNETYFFREEFQFDFLKEVVFPKYMGKELTIWTCCCSTGEEAVSLLALALSMNVRLRIYASDIDEKALSVLKNGRYSDYSLRTDGKKYHKLLEPYYTRKGSELIFNKAFINHIHTFKFNLIQNTLAQLPFKEEADIIFLRNAIIYFDNKTRSAVTKKVCERLKTGGILFFSMNEIASMNSSTIPAKLHKTNRGLVYYFVKDFSENSGQKEKEAAGKNKKMREEVHKARLQKFSEQNKKDSANAAGQKENHDKRDLKFDAKKTYERVCKEINERDFIKARAIARTITGENTKMYSEFMLGYIEYQADNRAEAEGFFISAEKSCPDFWPAYFYHGMVLRDLDKMKNARSCFLKCKQLVSAFGKKVPYDFALDSFSPSYINSLCETFSVEESSK